MNNIDLTLRSDFSDKENLLFDDARFYINSIGVSSTSYIKSKKSILDCNHKSILKISFIYSEISLDDDTVRILKPDPKENNNGFRSHQDTFDITGIMTKEYRFECEAAHGSPDTCDCCGKSINVLNSKFNSLCEVCENEYNYNENDSGILQ